MRALIPGAPSQSWYEKVCIWGRDDRIVAGPGNFGIFLRFCEAVVAMKKFAYGVNAGEERAASPKGGPANWFLGIISIITQIT